MINLTSDILDSFPINEIVYAEVAESGAMGNDGGIIIYIVQNGQLNCYETDIFTNQELYQKASKLFHKPLNRNKVNSIKVNKAHFEYHYGGVGNHVFLNKTTNYNTGEGCITFNWKNNNYQITCSFIGVFNCLAYSLNNPKKDTDPGIVSKAKKLIEKLINTKTDETFR